jgi:hypothetical protein
VPKKVLEPKKRRAPEQAPTEPTPATVQGS